MVQTTLTKALSEETKNYVLGLSGVMEDVPIAAKIWREGLGEHLAGWAVFGGFEKDLLASMTTHLDKVEHGLTPSQKLDFVKFLDDHVLDLSCKVTEYLEEEAAKMDYDVVCFLEEFQSSNGQSQRN